MIIPTLKIEVFKKKGSDGYGQALIERQPDEKVAPVRLEFASTHTTVRTDSAGSKGHAQEAKAAVVLLATPKTRVAIDDQLVCLGHKLKVVSAHPRYDVTGKLDHVQLECVAWS